ncbi:hypothetical protein GCM10025857_18780 [Alicyclobacillus contaminans]|uniref:spore cortex biosynthesis protein YabQ n=1 Tax=Alicyclobacillus contaminans TaxID=392016 RepID=UPI000429CEDF|nr:spore cortex biosynthesis protein YabQ [Alicyclobacillus contaminans]GMA50521.1 hypothetical protein GCM10025857_18780 [Alicyclobacillus contaminans]
MGSQVSYIASLLLMGLLMGVVFDIYNTVTGASKWLRWLRSTLDLAFWIVSAVAVYYVAFITDDGMLRVYTFGLLLAGWLIHRVTLHRPVVRSAFYIVRMVQAILRSVLRVLQVLTIRPIRLLCLLVIGILRVLYTVLCVLESWGFRVAEFWLRLLLVRWLLQRPLIQRFFAKCRMHWEEFCGTVSKWLLKRWGRA